MTFVATMVVRVKCVSDNPSAIHKSYKPSSRLHTARSPAAATMAPVPLEIPEERAARLEDITLAARFGDPFFLRITALRGLVNSYTGPRYMGPVIVVSDAETYSCGDVFASNVQDNGVALLVGVYDFTGGSGSIVAFNTELFALIPDGPFVRPKGVRI